MVFEDGLLSEATDGFRRFLADTGIEAVAVERARLGDALGDADAVVCYRLTPEQTADASRLRLVQCFSAGADGIAREALPSGCVLCNVRGHEGAMAEWVLMAMLALHRRLLGFDRDLRRGRWHREGEDYLGETPAGDLAEQTVGTVGLGAIGVAVAERARCLGMRAIAVTRSPSPERAARHGLDWLGSLDELPRLLEESDFAVVCLPLHPETRGLIGRRELDALGPDGFLINVARGPIVEEGALYEALRGGRIAGAALDVWWNYPKRDDPQPLPASVPFWELDNVVMTPHVSGRSETANRKRYEFVAEQLRRLDGGEPLENVLEVG